MKTIADLVGKEWLRDTFIQQHMVDGKTYLETASETDKEKTYEWLQVVMGVGK